MFSSRVPASVGAPLSLPDYLAERFTYFDRETWIEKIEKGKVTIDNRTASAGDTVTKKQMITYDAGDFEEPDADLSYSIIYEDSWLFAVNKPGNLLIHRAGRSFRNNLIYQLRSVRTPRYPDAHSIHRIDRNTSGIVLIAKNSRVQSEMSRQFRERKVRKQYVALVHGVPAPSLRQIDSPLKKDVRFTAAPKFTVEPAGKEAHTRIDSCEAIGKQFAQLEISPLTGRTHQIRVHCAYAGHPLVGDSLYGSDLCFATLLQKKTVEPGNSRTGRRHALHCRTLLFYHPYLKRICTIEAPVPRDMQLVKKYLSEIKTMREGR